jgi:hypothetical protein
VMNVVLMAKLIEIHEPLRLNHPVHLGKAIITNMWITDRYPPI